MRLRVRPLFAQISCFGALTAGTSMALASWTATGGYSGVTATPGCFTENWGTVQQTGCTTASMEWQLPATSSGNWQATFYFVAPNQDYLICGMVTQGPDFNNGYYGWSGNANWRGGSFGGG